MDLELAGKTAIVTGGSRGIGKAVATELAQEGVDVAIVARTQSALDATAREISERTQRRIVPLVADTGSDEAVRAMVEAAARELGHLDVLVNCAAQPALGPSPLLAGTTDEMFWKDMNTKVLGYLRCARAVAPHMTDQKWGRIISISGMAARQAGSIVGSMRNVAVVAMSKNLADQLGPHGVNVTVVHPATTWTERGPEVLAARAAAQGVSEEEMRKRLEAGSSSRRIITAQEVAYVVTFLASPKALAINGDVIPVGGGVPGPIYY